MRTLSAAELLSVWEWGIGQAPVRQALGLLMAAYPDISPETLTGLSIGQRDSRLLQLRQAIFGVRLVSVAWCPACGEQVELDFKISDLPVSPVEPVETLVVNEAGYKIFFRLLTSQDEAVLAGVSSVAGGRQRLLDRCIVRATFKGHPVSGADLPAVVVAALLKQMEQADPMANIQLDLNCPWCKHQWQVLFDIVSFFWNEINAWAGRALQEVHLLASVYGWCEEDILAMSAWRRQYYLKLVER